MSELDDVVEQLRQKRDELRVQMHLASKEFKEEWEDLEKTSEHFVAQAGLGKTGEGVGKALGQLGNELKLGYQRIIDAVKNS